MAATTIQPSPHPHPHRTHALRLPLLAAAAASLSGVAAAVILTGDDDPAIAPVAVGTPFQAASTSEQLGAELEAMVAAITGIVDPTQVTPVTPTPDAAPSGPSAAPPMARTDADLQSGAIGIAPTYDASLTETLSAAVGGVPGGGTGGS